MVVYGKNYFLDCCSLNLYQSSEDFSYFYQEDLTADNDAFTPWGRFLRRHFSEPLPPFAKYGIIVMIIAAVLIMACMYFFA